MKKFFFDDSNYFISPDLKTTNENQVLNEKLEKMKKKKFFLMKEEEIGSSSFDFDGQRERL